MFPIHLFHHLQTGTSWEDCWIWRGGTKNGGRTPVARIEGRPVNVRVHIRALLRPERAGRSQEICSARCVHPDH